MYSRGHAVLSALVGIPIGIGASTVAEGTALWGFVLVLGVGIDLDHFVIARINRGDWTNARRCLRDPGLVFADQGSIFDGGDVYRDQRLLSHVAVGGVLVAGLWIVREYWAMAAAVALYVHVAADLYSDVRTRDEYIDGME